MRNSEIQALRDLYINVAVTRALDEIDNWFGRSEAEIQSQRELETQLRAEALAAYQQQRGLLANDEEFETLVWVSVREDLLREVWALELMTQ